MREQVHTSLTAFRINPALLAAASAKAKKEGVTLSELLRHAVRKEVRDAHDQLTEAALAWFVNGAD